MGGGVSLDANGHVVVDSGQSPVLRSKEISRRVWSLGLGSVTPSSKIDEEIPIDSSLTKVPTYDDINPFESMYSIQSKLGR